MGLRISFLMLFYRIFRVVGYVFVIYVVDYLMIFKINSFIKFFIFIRCLFWGEIMVLKENLISY